MLTDEQRHAVYEVRYALGRERVDWEVFKEAVDGLGFGKEQEEAQDFALDITFEQAEIHVTSRLKSVADMVGRQRKESLVQGLIPRDGFGRINGEPAAGKSFVVLDLMLSIVRNVPEWLGRQIYARGNVVYAMTEGSFDFSDRVAAWEIGHPDYKPVDGQDLYIIDQELGDIMTEEGAIALGQDMNAVDPVLLVIDTQRGALPSIEENENGPMNVAAQRLKATAFARNCAILLVHHTPLSADGQERGSGASSVRANCDFELVVQAAGKDKPGKVKGTKAKYSRLPNDHKMTLHTVEIEGELDEAGNAVSACWVGLELVPDKATASTALAEKVREAEIVMKETDSARARRLLTKGVEYTLAEASMKAFGNRANRSKARVLELEVLGVLEYVAQSQRLCLTDLPI